MIEWITAINELFGKIGKRNIQMVYFFSFNKNVENYVESVNKAWREHWNLQEFYSSIIKIRKFEVFHNERIVKLLSKCVYKLYKKCVNWKFFANFKNLFQIFIFYVIPKYSLTVRTLITAAVKSAIIAAKSVWRIFLTLIQPKYIAIA